MLFKREKYQIKSNSIGFYQDLEHLDGIGISAVSQIYTKTRREMRLLSFILEKVLLKLQFIHNQILNQKI